MEYAPNSFAGTVPYGLNNDNGGVFTFKVDPDAAPLPKIIDGPRFYSFSSFAQGAGPQTGLILGPNGLLYGTAEAVPLEKESYSASIRAPACFKPCTAFPTMETATAPTARTP